MKPITLFLLLSLVILTFTSCRHHCQDPSNPDCENYDPCYAKIAPTANFYIYENIIWDIDNLGFEWVKYDADTIATAGVNFEAQYPNAISYEWHIGSEVLYGRRVYRESFPENADIPITLKVTTHRDNLCFPNVMDTIITKTKTFHVPDYSQLLYDKYKGKFRGVLEDEPNSPFVFEVKTSIDNHWSTPERVYDFYGLPHDDSINTYSEDGGSFNQRLFYGYVDESDDVDLNTYLHLYINKSYDTLWVNYVYRGNSIVKHFKGVRVN